MEKPRYSPEEAAKAAKEFEGQFGIPTDVTLRSLTSGGKPPTISDVREAVREEGTTREETAAIALFPEKVVDTRKR